MFAKVRDVFFEDEEHPDKVTKRGQVLDVTKSDFLRIIKEHTGKNYSDVEIVPKVHTSEQSINEKLNTEASKVVNTVENKNIPEVLTGEVVTNGVQTEKHGLVVGFSKTDIETYDSITDHIDNLCRQTENNAKDIAFNLYKIYNHGLYRVDGYKNIYDYANAKFNLARGTTNNFINLVDRFGSNFENGQMIEDKSNICEQYQGYSHSQLIAMLGHTDDELKDINADMSVREIKRILKKKDNPVDESAETGTEAEQIEMPEVQQDGFFFVLSKNDIFCDCKRKGDDFKKEVLIDYIYKHIDGIFDSLKKYDTLVISYIAPEAK